MKRPAAVFCLFAFGVQLAAAILPRAVFGLSAAFFILLGILSAVRLRKAFLWCAVLGVAAGVAAFSLSAWYNLCPARLLAGRELALVATVESVAQSYADGMVSAVLRVESAQDANGRNAAPHVFLCDCACLPQCAPGDRIAGRFALLAPETSDLLASYADGVFLQAEYIRGFDERGQAQTLRARLARLRTLLSGNVRRYLNTDTGGILAAMSVGDRSFVTQRLTNAYRAAGLSHILVVSGLHLSLVCGLFRVGREKPRKGRLQKLFAACLRLAAALGLMGITGCTPSVLRAGMAVLIANFGVLLLSRPDGLTSLAAAAFLLLLPNGYAAWDVCLQLSLAATGGVLAGSAAAKFGRTALEERLLVPKQGDSAVVLVAKDIALRRACLLWETLCIAVFAVLATFPVLTVWGMNVSLMALASCFVSLALAGPILVCGLGAALCGLTVPLRFLQRGFALCGGVLVKLLNRWAVSAGAAAGSGLHFETQYAVVVYAVLLGVYLLARHKKLSCTLWLPALAVLLSAAVALGALLSRNVVTVVLVGNAWNPAVVVTENGAAMVLFRGNRYNEQRVTEYLTQRGISEAELVIDLRLAFEEPCAIAAKKTEILAYSPRFRSRVLQMEDVNAELYRTLTGGIVRLDIGGVTLAVSAGSIEMARPAAVDYLLGAAGTCKSILPRVALCRSEKYRWLAQCEAESIVFGGSGLGVRLRPGGGAQLLGVDA